MTKRIIGIKNGPFLVENVRFLKSASGKNIEVEESYTLCRCGESMDKPFCDGLHEIFEYEDEKDPYRTPDQVEVYKGELITIYENRGVCSHRGFCYEDLPQVWRMEKGLRIDMSVVNTQEMVDKVIDICRRCPSGALSFSLPSEERDLDGFSDEGTISIAPRRYGYDGPFEVTGGVAYSDDAGNKPESKDHYALCRCGKSKNMPFCSGEHWKAKFLDENNDEE